jgi:putative SOS response-associated peptidase YedK
MCGRYALVVDASALIGEFELDAGAPDVTESFADYNVAPTKHMPVVVQTPEGRAAQLARWGFLPSWAKDPSIGSRMINARSETAAEKPAFRSSFTKRRCLVPASGYYEWYRPTAGGLKQPFYIHRTDGRHLAMAGLYSWWRPSEGEPWQLTYAVLTGAAIGELAHIHDRVPMLVADADWAAWLDPDAEGDPIQLVHPTEHGHVVATPVTTRVNNVRNNGPELLEPIGN